MRHVACVLALTALLAGRAWADDEQKPGSEAPEGIPVYNREPKSTAAAVLRVTCDPESGLSNPGLIDNLLTSRELLHAAIAFVSSEAAKSAQPPEDNFDIDGTTVPLSAERSKDRPQIDLTIDPALGSTWRTDRVPAALPAGVYMSRIDISSFDERVGAGKFLRVLADQLRLELGLLDVDQKQFELMKQAGAEISEGIVRRRKELQRLREALGIALAEDAAQELYARQAADLTAMRVEVEGSKVRRKALETQIAALSAAIDESAGRDEVVQELAKVVAARETQRTRLQALKNNGAVSDQSTREADIALAEAKAELAKQRRAAAQAAGGERLANLQRRLDETTIELAENEEKLEHLPKAISRDTADLAQRQLDIELKEQQYRDVVTEINRLELRMHTRRPTVTIIPLD